MNRLVLMLSVAALGVALAFVVRPAAGQHPPRSEVTCQTFALDNGGAVGSTKAAQDRLAAAAHAHASAVQQWLAERAAAGQATPMYQGTIDSAANAQGHLQYAVVCVR